MDYDLNVRFNYHPPRTDETVKQHVDVRAVLKTAAEQLVANCPPGRELLLAITKLEEAMFWANASIARHNSVIGETK